MTIWRLLYILAALMLGAGVLVGATGPADASAGELRQEKREQFDPGMWKALGCHDPGTPDVLFDSEDCGERKLFVMKEVWVDDNGVVPLTEVAFCPGPEGSVHPLRAPCPNPSQIDPMWQNCADGGRVGVGQHCTKRCPPDGLVVREDAPCPSAEEAAGPPTCASPKENVNGQCLDPCPQAFRRAPDGTCTPPRYVPTTNCWGHRLELGKWCPIPKPPESQWQPCPDSPGVDTYDGVCPKP